MLSRTSPGSGCSVTCERCARPPSVSARVLASAPRFLPETLELAEAGFVPGGTQRNREAIEPVTGWEPGIPDALRTAAVRRPDVGRPAGLRAEA